MTEDTRRHALSFGRAATDYDRFRPGYPAEAVSWALGRVATPLRVVDLGAGTGLLTRVLLGLGHHVVPVEPDEGMRAQLARATPGTTALAGSAERIPLPDADADAMVAGPRQRQELDDAVRDLVATHPDLAGRDRFALPYRTHVYRARRR